MLLFLFILFLYYGCFNCDGIDTAKFDESVLLDKHYQNLLQVNTVLKDVQQNIHNMSVLKESDDKHKRRRDKEVHNENTRDFRRIKKPENNQNSKNLKNHSAKFHLSPQSHLQPTIPERRQGLNHWFPPPSRGLNLPNPLSALPQPPPGYRMAIVPFNPGPRLGRPGFLLRPMRSIVNPNQLLSDYQHQNVYLRPPHPYLPSPFYTPGSALPASNQSFLDAEANSFLPGFNLLSPSLFPPDSNLAKSVTSERVPILSSSIRPNMGKGVKIRLQGLYSIYVPFIDKWNNASNDQSPPLSSEGTAVPTPPHSSATATVSTTNGMPNINVYQSGTGAADAAQLFMEDEEGFLYVKLPQKGATPVPVPHYSKIWESTTAGDVFYGKIKVQTPSPLSPTQRYLELVDRLNEGFMLVFMIELCRLIAVKNPKEVQQALYHTETIYNHLWKNGRLTWIDEPLQTVMWKLAVLMSEGDIDVVQTYASMMFHMLLRRKQTLSSEVNSILDEAGGFYNDVEGEQLFYALMEFENYPNTTKSSYWLCDNLIESFLRPFRRRRQFRPRRRQRLLDAINTALKKRFPRLQTEHSKGKPEKELKPRKKKRKRHHYPYKMLRRRKKHNRINHDIMYESLENTITDDKNSILRSVTPANSDQATFRAIPVKNYRIKKRPRKTDFYLNRPARTYTINKERNRKLSHKKAGSPFQEKLDDTLARSNDKSTKKTRHHFDQKMSSTPSTGPVLLASSSSDRLKRAQKDEIHYYPKKEERFKKSEVKKRNKRGKTRAELRRTISDFPTMSRSAHRLSV